MSVEVVCSFLGRSGTLWTKQYQHNTQQEVSCNMVVSQKRLNFFQLINISFNCSFLFILIPSSNQLASFYAFIFLMKSSLPSFGNALNVAIFSCYCCSFIHNRMVGMLHLWQSPLTSSFSLPIRHPLGYHATGGEPSHQWQRGEIFIDSSSFSIFANCKPCLVLLFPLCHDCFICREIICHKHVFWCEMVSHHCSKKYTVLQTWSPSFHLVHCCIVFPWGQRSLFWWDFWTCSG